jgi:hypothetical protein
VPTSGAGASTAGSRRDPAAAKHEGEEWPLSSVSESALPRCKRRLAISHWRTSAASPITLHFNVAFFASCTPSTRCLQQSDVASHVCEAALRLSSAKRCMHDLVFSDDVKSAVAVAGSKSSSTSGNLSRLSKPQSVPHTRYAQRQDEASLSQCAAPLLCVQSALGAAQKGRCVRAHDRRVSAAQADQLGPSLCLRARTELYSVQAAQTAPSTSRMQRHGKPCARGLRCCGWIRPWRRANWTLNSAPPSVWQSTPGQHTSM